MKISPRNIIIIVAALFVLGVVAVVLLLVVPQVNRMNTLDGQIKTANTDVQNAETLLAQRRSIKDRAAFTEDDWLRLANEVPENPELPSLIIEMQDTAYASGVTLNSIKPAAVAPKPTAEAGTFLSMPVHVAVEGSWFDTIDYMQRLIKLERQVRILKFVSQRSSMPGSTDVVTDLDIEVYVIPAQSAAPAAAAVPAPAGK